MKKFWDSILRVTETIGTARAANALATMGHHEQAKNLMMELAKNESKNNI